MVVGVVLMLLLVNLYFLWVILEPPPDDDGNGGDGPPSPDHPWNITVAPQVISEETEWVGRTGRLERPVLVADGGLLRLDSCHLELHEEDIIWFDGPFFQVEEGGVLEVTESVLEVVKSPIDDEVLVGPVWSDRDIPQISRVVNLEGTDWPVLTFDLRWRFEGTPLSIAVQSHPTDGLVELERVDPEGPCEDWLHVEVPLSDYIDEMPRIVIYPSVYPEDVYFIKDLNITDDGEVLPFDLPPTDDHYYRRWLDDGFVRYWNAQIWRWDVEKVLDIQGHVYINGSTIRVPPEIERRGSTSYEREDNRYWHQQKKNIWTSIRSMHVEVDNGELVARDSIFEHVPIIANSSQLDLGGCRFESAFDMVTMWNCTALLSDSDFIRKGLAEYMRSWDPSYARAIWAISVENNTGLDTTRIINCRFQDVEQAIDLGYANYIIEDCTFQRVTELCIWDHASEGTTEWENLSAVNSFQYCTGYLYMRTGTTDLYFNGTQARHWNETIWDTEGEVIDDIKVHPDMQWSFWTKLHARLVRLDMLVETVDRVRVMDHIDMVVHAETPPHNNWYDRLTVTIGAGVDSMYVDLFPLFVEQVGYPWEVVDSTIWLGKVWPAGNAEVGTYNLTIRIGSGHLYVYNISLDLYLDDREVLHIDEEEFWGYLAIFGYIEHTQFFEPGPHELRVTISGNRLLDETHVSVEREVFANQTFHIMRAAATNTSEEIEEFLKAKGVVLAVDADTNFELDDLQPSNASWEDFHASFFLTGGRGSGLTFRGFINASDLFLMMTLFSPMDLHFSNTEVPDTYLSVSNYHLTYNELMEIDPQAILAEITIRNCTTNWMSLDLWQSALRVSDTEGDGGIDVSARVNATVSFHNVTDSYLSSYASGPIWSYTVTDSHFGGRNASGFDINAEDIRTLRISNCTFDHASLQIDVKSPYKGPWELDVTDCEFFGNGSYLSVLWSSNHRSYWGENPASFPIPQGSISGNTFSGDGTAVVLHHALHGTTFVDNTIEDGAQAWAWYWTKIRAQPDISTSNDHKITILKSNDLLTEFPVPNGPTSREEHYFYEVTEDLGGPLEPPAARVVIQWYTARGHRLMVTDFARVDLGLDLNTITYKVWPDLQGVLPLSIKDWPWDLEKWEGGKW